MLKAAEELGKLSDDREQKRAQYWKDFHTQIRPHIMDKIASMMEDENAIYWRSITTNIALGRAEKAHLENLGYSIGSSNGYTNQYSISW